MRKKFVHSMNYCFLCIYLFLFSALPIFIYGIGVTPALFNEFTGITGEVDAVIFDHMPCKHVFLETFGAVNRISEKSVIATESGRILNNNGYLIGTSEKADAVYNYEQTESLWKLCARCGVDFCYFNLPAKIDDESIVIDKGYWNYCIKDGEAFINMLENLGVSCFNVRHTLLEKYPDFYTAFYRTDHHWTVQAGLYATKEMVRFLNNRFGYGMAGEMLDEDKYSQTEYSNVWLGETGRQTSANYIGLDNFTYFLPRYDTDFTIYSFLNEEVISGSFEKTMVDRVTFDSKKSLYDTRSWHYSYLPYGSNNRVIVNNTIEDGVNVLLIKDSYSHVVAPFLAQCCKKVALWDMREHQDISLMEYISENDFDLVTVAYMEGCLSNPVMFEFNEGE